MNSEICNKCKHNPTIFASHGEGNFKIHCLPMNYPFHKLDEKIIENVYVFPEKESTKISWIYAMRKYNEYGLKVPFYMKRNICVNKNCPYYLEHEMSYCNEL